MVSRIIRALVALSRRAGVRQNRAMSGSDQPSPDPRSARGLPRDRTAELVRRSREVLKDPAEATRLFVQYDLSGTRDGDGQKDAHGDATQRTPAPMAAPDCGREPLSRQPLSATIEGRVFAHCALCGAGLVRERHPGEKGCWRYVHDAQGIGAVCRNVRTIYYRILSDRRHPIWDADHWIEKYDDAPQTLGTHHVETKKI